MHTCSSVVRLVHLLLHIAYNNLENTWALPACALPRWLSEVQYHIRTCVQPL